MPKRIGVLTGGGDTSALNATLKGVALKAEELGYELIGFMEGWKGVLKGGDYFTLTPDLIDENRGGTILKSSRTNLIKDDKLDEVVDNLRDLKIEGLIPIGGDDTLTVAAALSERAANLTMAFVTKTIDNDVGTNPPEGDSIDYSQMVNYFCPGFPTAANRLIGYVQDLRTTVYSHDRILFIEAMGRNASWLSLAAAYGQADLILISEVPYDGDRLAQAIRKKHEKNGNVIIVLSEGVRIPKEELSMFSDEELNRLIGETEVDAFGHVRLEGVSALVTEAMRKRLSETSVSGFRNLILGYLQRCGRPIEIDRVCAIKAGQLAVSAIAHGDSNTVAAIMRTDDGIQPILLPLTQVIKLDETEHVIQRSLDRRFYDADNFQISRAGIEYFRPIFGDLPRPYQPPELNIQQI